MKTQKILNLKKTFLDMTIFRWPKRFLSIVLMVPLVITGFVTIISWLLRPLLLLVSYLFDGLSVLLIGFLIRLLEPMGWIMLLRQTQIRFIFVLTNLLTKCLLIDRTLRKLSTSWIVLLEKRLNHLLIKVIRSCLDT